MAGELKRLTDPQYRAGGTVLAESADMHKLLELLGRAYAILSDEDAVCQAGTECAKWIKDYEEACGDTGAVVEKLLDKYKDVWEEMAKK